MRRWKLGLFLSLVLVFLMVAGACAPGGEQKVAPADLYKNNTVTLIIPTKPGGGSDLAARIFAQFWTGVTGGKVVVENEPGAGGLVGVNKVAAAKPDGLTIGLAELQAQLVSPYMWKDPGCEWEPTKLNYIGFFAPGPPQLLTISAKAPYNTLADLQKAEGIRFPSAENFGTLVIASALTADFFKMKNAKIITGFKGTSDVQLAVGRGEVDCYVMNSREITDALATGIIKPPLFTFGYERSPWFPQVPTLMEVTKLTSAQEELFKAYLALRAGKTIYAPGNLPKDRLKFLREAFVKVVTSEGAVKELEKEWKYLAKEYLTGEKVEERVAEMVRIEEKYIPELEKLLAKYKQ